MRGMAWDVSAATGVVWAIFWAYINWLKSSRSAFCSSAVVGCARANINWAMDAPWRNWLQPVSSVVVQVS